MAETTAGQAGPVTRRGPHHMPHGIPKPPGDLDTSARSVGRRARGFRAAPTDTVHHWMQGPQDVERARSGWRFRWYLDRHDGLTRRAALRLLYGVINHPLGWERTGVRFARTMDRSRAHILIRIAPAGESACGPGSAGCYCDTSCEDKAVAHIGSEYIDQPGAFAELVNMELGGHGCFRALDMYNAVHQPYNPGGCMGTWEDAARSGFMPSDAEISSAKAWLRGEAEFIHDD
jgi:hypothetical protein